MVLVIDIGNTTIAFTGLEEITVCSEGTAAGNAQLTAAGNAQLASAGNAQLASAGNSQLASAGNSQLASAGNSQLASAGNSQLASAGNSQLASAGNAQLSSAGNSQLTAPEKAQVSDLKIIFSEKIPTETGKDIELFLREAGAVLLKHGIGAGEEMVSGAKRISEQIPVRNPMISAVAISSVVPACTPAAEVFSEKICAKAPVIIGWRCDTGLSFENIPTPGQVGTDRIADAAWAAFRYPLPAMTVDMGTATTINVVSRDRKFLGGMIGSGVRTALHSLRTGTAQLPELVPVPVPREKLIGTDTSGCMLSAAVVGTAAMIDGLAAHVEEQIGSPLTLILTGGNAPIVCEWIRHSYVFEPGLAAKGSALIALREENHSSR